MAAARRPSPGKPIGSEAAAKLNPTGKTGPMARTPAIKREVADILDLNNLEPVQAIANSLNDLEKLFLEKQDKLSFKDQLEYYRLRVSVLERQQNFVYTKKALEYRSEKTNVSVDYSKMIEDLNKRAGVGDERLSKAMLSFKDKVDGIVSKDVADDNVISEQ